MKTYKYIARDINGTQSRGVLQAENADEVYRKLKEQNLFCTRLDEQEQGRDDTSPKISTKNIAFFCRQMNTMLSSGLTVVRALDILYNRADDKRCKDSFLRLYENIQKGLSLYEALKEQNGAYPALLVNMVRAGEASGTLDRMMSKMSDHYEREYRLNNQLKSSMIYPILLLGVTFVVMIGLFVLVLPKFFTMFEGAQLPLITQVVMAVSNFFIYQWYVGVIVVALVILLYRFGMMSPNFRRSIDQLKITMPLFGKLMKTICAARMTNALAVLYSSGVQMTEAVRISVAVLNNSYITERFSNVISEIEQGGMLSEAIDKTGIFDVMVTSMIYVGEESGSLDQMLLKLSDYYDQESETALQKIATLLEPCMLIIIAVLVGMVIAAVMLPTYSMYNTVL